MNDAVSLTCERSLRFNDRRVSNDRAQRTIDFIVDNQNEIVFVLSFVLSTRRITIAHDFSSLALHFKIQHLTLDIVKSVSIVSFQLNVSTIKLRRVEYQFYSTNTSIVIDCI
jgi:hypothetical protein